MVIHTGDCIEVMRTIPSESVDSVVTDPPAAVSFMGKTWDSNKGGRAQWVAWMTEVMGECHRVLKPGGYAVVWSLPRTCHWTGLAIEDAGFYIVDQLAHVFASGFPKGKTQLKPAREDWWLARKRGPLQPLQIDACRIEGAPRNPGFRNPDSQGMFGGADNANLVDYESPTGRWPSNVLLSDPELFDQANPWVVGSGATSVSTGGSGPASREWQGDGTQVGASWMHGGTGGFGDSGGYSRFFRVPEYGRSGMLSVCRNCGAPIADETSTTSPRPPNTAESNAATPPSESNGHDASDAASPSPSPATDTALRPAPTQPDGTPDSTATEDARTTKLGTSRRSRSSEPGPKPTTESQHPTDAGSAARSDGSIDTTTTTPSRWMCGSCAASVTPESTQPQPKPTSAALLPVERPDSPRYLIIPKADRADREPVLRGQLPERDAGSYDGNADVGGNRKIGARPDIPVRQRVNVHSTVKPTDLMRHLVRLVTPPGGTVLDCFLGSGTTAIACELEGFPWIGIEKEPEYVAIAKARLNGTQRGLGLDVPAPTKRQKVGPDKGGGTQCSFFPGKCEGHPGHGRYSPTIHANPREEPAA